MDINNVTAICLQKIVIGLYFGYKVTNKQIKKRARLYLFEDFFLSARNQQSFCACSNPQVSQRIVLTLSFITLSKNLLKSRQIFIIFRTFAV